LILVFWDNFVTMFGTYWSKTVIIGYARVSTDDQQAGLEAQRRDLLAAGVEKIFTEEASSVAKRASLGECLTFLRHGDTLMVTKPDRLARSTAELLAIEADLTHRHINLVVLSMGGERLDTRNPTSKLMLTILAGVATWEREIMLERQREGVAKAKAAGRYKGRKPTARAKSEDVLRLHDAGTRPVQIARELKISRSSVYRILPPVTGGVPSVS
jgi:DNA invertase Pin-like site-specific DNA recombinase